MEALLPDLATIAAAFGSIKPAMDIAKGWHEANVSLEKVGHKFQVAELIGALTQARLDIASIQDEVLSRDRQIRELQEQLDLRARMTYLAPFYWEERDGKRDGPFCQQCYDSQHKAIRLQDYGRNSWFCTTCKNSYDDSSGSRPRQSRADTGYDMFPP
jgi:hypothetical protein